MEPAREPQWAEHEKVYLLAEIIKAAPMSSHALLNIIREANIQPKWQEIPLPSGRSLLSCQRAYDVMAQTYPAPDYRHRPTLPAPIIYPSSDIAKKRPLQPEAATPTTSGRLLQPRPPHSFSGDLLAAPAYSLSAVGEPANKKKRGRPTKAEAQARADAAAARGEPYPPPRKARMSVTGTESTPGVPGGQPGPSGEARPSAETPPASVPPAPIAAALTPQPPQQAQSERGSESSSGKKRRMKPTPLELEKPYREPSETESPLAFGSAMADQSHSQAYSSFTPISAPLPSASESRDRDVRMETVEESQPRTTTPHSFKDTVGI
ncbi:hypothetical protein CC78DRAFT_345537 [Lojkania enalia]|uniref:AT hook domain-containing protein n=1 Tax=Lojkania enalia TaxID=147567 RepID=A0A9P4N7B1_9PLEO|nr:hypothetical protein CC78DRAFT_345537 [Didymosphaeria enalia]